MRPVSCKINILHPKDILWEEEHNRKWYDISELKTVSPKM